MKRILATLVGVLVLAGCGSTSVTQQLRDKHNCAQSFYMQCVTNPPIIQNKSLVFGQRLGLDFAYGAPPAAFAKSHGINFGASYLSGGTSKDFYAAQSYRNAGLGVVFVWETSANRPVSGGSYNANFNNGYNDAYYGFGEARRLGFPHAHIDFASDFDSTYYGGSILAYYRGAASAAKRLGGVSGAYGGLTTVTTVCNAHVGSLNWQTIAWSRGRWASTACAPLRQVSINSSWYGHSVDFDYAVAPNYGQSNFIATHVDKRHYEYYPTTSLKTQFGRISERQVVRSYDRARLHVASHRNLLGHLRSELKYLAGRIYTVSHHHGKVNWSVYHRRFRYQGLIHRAEGRKING